MWWCWVLAGWLAFSAPVAFAAGRLLAEPVIPTPFGSPGALLFPPDDDQLLASADCPSCGWHGTRWVWPAVARVGLGDRRLETPVGHERAACPECGVALDPKRRHPSHRET